MEQDGVATDCADRTDYGTASGSARGFAQHHSQQLSAPPSGPVRFLQNFINCSAYTYL